MRNPFIKIAVIASLASLATPAFSQDAEPEAPRTTYEIRYLDLAEGSDNDWIDAMNNHYIPARKAAGLPVPSIHWMMDGPWDIMMVIEMPDGLASLDKHASASRMAMGKALIAQEGSEEAMAALNEKTGKMVTRSMRQFSHTHP